MTVKQIWPMGNYPKKKKEIVYRMIVYILETQICLNSINTAFLIEQILI